jgi:hypothetical protein
MRVSMKERSGNVSKYEYAYQLGERRGRMKRVSFGRETSGEHDF